MHRVWVPLALALLLAPLAQGAGQEPATTDDDPPFPPAVQALLDIPGGGPTAARTAFLAQLEHQGLLDRGTVLAAGATPRPPALVFRDAYPTCDLDGDGRMDLFSNDLDLRGAPSLLPSGSRVQAMSGADGHVLWARDNLMHVRMQAAPGVSFERAGRPTPISPDGFAPMPDLDGDGVCDLIATGADDVRGFAVPLLNDPSISDSTLVVSAISGATGEDIWSQTIASRQVTAGAPPFITTERTTVSRNFPTGILVFDSPTGPKVAVKTSDLTYQMAQDPFGLTRIRLVPQQPELLKDRVRFETLKIDERVQLYDARSGDVLWTREFRSADGAGTTNVTWLAGAVDLAGDAEPEIVLDQLTIADPRGTEANDPTTGKSLFRYGRGMDVLALKGEAAGGGATLWTRVIVPLEPVRANAPVEENFEVLLWTGAQPGPDMDGDGRADVIASYVAQEEGLRGTINGAFRTHFVSLAGTNGTLRWDVRQQGWGVLRPIGTTPETSRFLGMGMVDIPSQPPPGGRFPPKFVRMGVLDGADGSATWTYERSFAENSYLAYNLALGQYDRSLAPIDLDRDGLLDLVTPAQNAPATGRDQVLLATSHHTYEVRSGRDGAVLREIPIWGPNGRLVPCDARDGSLTFLSGHGRRLDLTRVDPATGATLWRRPVFNDPAPRAATSAVDVLSLGARCADDGADTLVTVNVQAYSAVRRHEVVPILGALDASGAVQWMDPAVEGTPDTDERLFQASIRAARDDDERSILPAIAVGAMLGIGALGATLLLAQRGARALKFLALGLVLVAFLPVAPALDLAPPPIDLTLPSPSPLPSPLPSPPPESVPDVGSVASRLRALGYDAPGEIPFDENFTLSFTYAGPDMDGDGVDDVILDHYCDDYDCVYGPDITSFPREFTTEYVCGPRHHVYGISANKSVLWDIDLTMPGLVLSCGQAFVLGVVDVGEGRRGLLVYKFTQATVFGIEDVYLHEFVMYDAATGEPMWSFVERGTLVSDFLTTQRGESVIVNPILLDGALFLQGVGFTQSAANTLINLPPAGTNRVPVVFDVYQPDEWAARLDLATGEVLWRRDTFQPTQRNVLPQLIDGRSYYFAYGPNTIVSDRYWDSETCCLDVTGDGEADLVYRTLEWSMLPNANVNGPYSTDSRLVVLDGATGVPAIDRIVAKDIAAGPAFRRDFSNTMMAVSLRHPAYLLSYQRLGDADGDGVADLLQHEAWTDVDYHRRVSVVSGKTGEPLWNVTQDRDLRALVLGDADGDGGADVALVDWWSHEGVSMKDDDYNTPGETPIVVRSGRDGRELWRTASYAAPSDVVEQFLSMRRQGLADLDGDGVGDLAVDAPEYLGDQTVIHRLRFLSGRDGALLHEASSVGAFALPTRVGDIDRDGRDEYAVVSGDVNDLWLTLRNGADGTALWSRRIVAVPASGYAEALPKLRVHLLPDENATRDVLVVDFHLKLRTWYVFNGIFFSVGGAGGSAGERVGFIDTTLPQVLALDARDGSSLWGIPTVKDVDRFAYVAGETPGTVMLARVLEEASLSGQAADAAPAVVVGAASFGGVYALGIGLTVGITRYARRFEGVPDLD